MDKLSEKELQELVQQIVQRTLGDSDSPPSSSAGSEAAPGAQDKPSTETKPRKFTRRIAIAADHGGYKLKETLKPFLQRQGYQVDDCGTHSEDSVDYPDFAYAVAKKVSQGEAWRGIIIDGAGIGSCMAANKVLGVRASMCYDHATAINSREHNDANVLTLGAKMIDASAAQQIVMTWLDTIFAGGRHAPRVDKIMAIEKKERI